MLKMFSLFHWFGSDVVILKDNLKSSNHFIDRLFNQSILVTIKIFQENKYL